jgi:membrane peptidoglycan carboxypeptidase
VLVTCCLLVLAVVAAATLYLLSPSVGDAGRRVRALDRRHGVARAEGQVPARFAEAIVASEDSRFYSEPGVDPLGILRAAWFGLTGSGDGGGSTISQQLVKGLYTGGRSGLRQDAEQVALAVKLNVHYSKAQILRMYAASVYFGHGFYGLHDASCGYFGVSPLALSLAQASMLAGLVQAPSAYDPLAHPRLARERQRYVVDRLVATGKISAAHGRSTLQAPLRLHASPTAGGCPGAG